MTSAEAAPPWNPDVSTDDNELLETTNPIADASSTVLSSLQCVNQGNDDT